MLSLSSVFLGRTFSFECHCGYDYFCEWSFEFHPMFIYIITAHVVLVIVVAAVNITNIDGVFVCKT